MGLFDLIKGLFGGGGQDDRATVGRNPQYAASGQDGGSSTTDAASSNRSVSELARRLGVTEQALTATPVHYQRFTLPKRSGGTRNIDAPAPALKAMQRRILHRLLARLPAHPAACGFERGQSIATHAARHAHQAVVLHMDLQGFFPSTSDRKVAEYFRRLGWDRAAVAALTRLCTHKGALPQGAPTSPRLSNLVNYRMDLRLEAGARHLARKAADARHRPAERGQAAAQAIAYSRYADDLTFSFAVDAHGLVNEVIHLAQAIVEDEGYRLHTAKKLRIMRQHERQMVTGLVVNDGVDLPRRTRRWLRAVRHHLAAGRPATLTPPQLAGWTALEHMVNTQATSGRPK